MRILQRYDVEGLDSDVYAKTIVFCVDIEHAERMRQALLQYAPPEITAKNDKYIVRITGDDPIAKGYLENFINPEETYPVIATTSEMLSTGVDCKTCGLIVIDKEIGSMTEFKQIVGRGTRLRIDKGKWHFEILDFRNATQLFKDPEFDGDPDPKDDEGGKKGGNGGSGGRKGGEGGNGKTGEGHRKYIVDGHDIRITHEKVSYLGADGHTLVTESLTDFTRKSIRGKYATLDDFINNWNEVDRKKVIVDELKEYNVLIDAVREANPQLAEADIFDIICHVAFDRKPMTRRERANNVKKRDYLSKYQGMARQVLETLLDKYADNGIIELENENVLELPPFNQIGTPVKIIKLFGGIAGYMNALTELKTELYRSVA